MKPGPYSAHENRFKTKPSVTVCVCVCVCVQSVSVHGSVCMWRGWWGKLRKVPVQCCPGECFTNGPERSVWSSVPGAMCLNWTGSRTCG